MKKNTVLSQVTHHSDGCTLAPDLNLYECCAEHDWYYSSNSDETRFNADIQLAKCIHEKHHPWLAIIYFVAVRMFGGRYYEGYKDKN